MRTCKTGARLFLVEPGVKVVWLQLNETVELVHLAIKVLAHQGAGREPFCESGRGSATRIFPPSPDSLSTFLCVGIVKWWVVADHLATIDDTMFEREAAVCLLAPADGVLDVFEDAIVAL